MKPGSLPEQLAQLQLWQCLEHLENRVHGAETPAGPAPGATPSARAVPDRVAEALGPQLSRGRAHKYCEPDICDAEPSSDLDLDSLTPEALSLVRVLAGLSKADRQTVLRHRRIDLPFDTEEAFQEYITPDMVS